MNLDTMGTVTLFINRKLRLSHAAVGNYVKRNPEIFIPMLTNLKIGYLCNERVNKEDTTWELYFSCYGISLVLKIETFLINAFHPLLELSTFNPPYK